MLVLTRKKGQSIFIGDDITITIVKVGAGQVQIGIQAPSGMPIQRDDMKSGPKSKGKGFDDLRAAHAARKKTD